MPLRVVGVVSRILGKGCAVCGGYGQHVAPVVLDGGGVPLDPHEPHVVAAVYALIILSVIDLELMIIPDRFSLGLIVLGLAFAWANPNFSGVWWQKELSSLLGAGVGLFGVLAIALIGTWMFKKEAMGGGDVKLMGGVGAFIGWEGVITTVVFASFFGLVYALFLMIFKGKKGGDAIPFGPFLSLGALINLLWLIKPAMLVIEI